MFLKLSATASVLRRRRTLGYRIITIRRKHNEIALFSANKRKNYSYICHKTIFSIHQFNVLLVNNDSQQFVLIQIILLHIFARLYVWADRGLTVILLNTPLIQLY
jgi:hypothetical protein